MNYMQKLLTVYLKLNEQIAAKYQKLKFINYNRNNVRLFCSGILYCYLYWWLI